MVRTIHIFVSLAFHFCLFLDVLSHSTLDCREKFFRTLDCREKSVRRICQAIYIIFSFILLRRDINIIPFLVSVLNF